MKQSLQLNELEQTNTPKKSIFNFFLLRPQHSKDDVNFKSVLRRLSFFESRDKQLLTLLKTIEIKDPYTKGHSESVAYYATLIAKSLDLDEQQVEKIQFAALLHDVGKIMIDRKILSKPSKLNNTEESIIKKHPEMGARILSSINVSKDVIEAVMHHHERWDGNGYPNRLFAYEIPFYARILAVADAFDAMISDRPYRSKKEIHYALDEISQSSGYQFDPELSELFIRIAEKM